MLPVPPVAERVTAAAPARLAALTAIDVPPAFDPALDPVFAAPARPAAGPAVGPEALTAPVSAEAAVEPNDGMTVQPRALPVAPAALPPAAAVAPPRIAVLVYPPPFDVIAAVMLQASGDHRARAVGNALATP